MASETRDAQWVALDTQADLSSRSISHALSSLAAPVTASVPIPVNIPATPLVLPPPDPERSRTPTQSPSAQTDYGPQPSAGAVRTGLPSYRPEHISHILQDDAIKPLLNDITNQLEEFIVPLSAPIGELMKLVLVYNWYTFHCHGGEVSVSGLRQGLYLNLVDDKTIALRRWWNVLQPLQIFPPRAGYFDSTFENSTWHAMSYKQLLTLCSNISITQQYMIQCLDIEKRTQLMTPFLSEQPEENFPTLKMAHAYYSSVNFEGKQFKMSSNDMWSAHTASMNRDLAEWYCDMLMPDPEIEITASEREERFTAIAKMPLTRYILADTWFGQQPFKIRPAVEGILQLSDLEEASTSRGLSVFLLEKSTKVVPPEIILTVMTNASIIINTSLFLAAEQHLQMFYVVRCCRRTGTYERRRWSDEEREVREYNRQFLTSPACLEMIANLGDMWLVHACAHGIVWRTPEEEKADEEREPLKCGPLTGQTAN
ncbi:hypothetical protein HWV62_22185 [Athelia sp. TMB]|nr:hypothetical protein HWV62_22185 [Athelia sp. TMB]